jgi:serine/threonine protein phosphatase PrpC
MELIAHYPTSERMANCLMRTALNDSKCNDNVTIIVVRL